MKGALEMGTEAGLLKAQLALARDTLKSAWSDVYFNTYTWAVFKARRAAWIALAALARASGLATRQEDPLSLLAATAETGCEPRGSLVDAAILLDYTWNLYHDSDLYLILWYSTGKEWASKDVALSSLEKSLFIIDSVEECTKMEIRLQDARPRLATSYFRASIPGTESTIFLIGSKLIYVSSLFEGVDPVSRINLVSSSLPAGFIHVLLSPPEAYALLNLPWPLEEGVEIVRDDLGFAPLIKKRETSIS